MEKREAQLAEGWRATYRAFRQLGLAEEEAFHATLGRDGAEPRERTGLNTDALAEAFERMGMSSESARHAAGGRRSTYEQTRSAEVDEIRRRVNEASDTGGSK